jgi:hypothetical protein
MKSHVVINNLFVMSGMHILKISIMSFFNSGQFSKRIGVMRCGNLEFPFIKY